MKIRKPAIVIVTNVFLPTLGGITTYVGSLVRELTARRYETYICSFPYSVLRREEADSNPYRRRILHELAVAAFTVRILGMILRLRLGGKRVIVHAQSASFCMGVGVAAKLLGAHVVHTFHSPIEHCSVRLRALLPFVDVNVCVSEEHRSQYVIHCGISEDVPIIPGGVDCDEFTPIDEGRREEKRQEMMKSFGIEDLHGPILLFVGRVVKEKGIGVLVQAARRVTSRIKNAIFLVVGPLDQSRDQEEQLQDIRRQVVRDMNFFIVGKLSNQELRNAYGISDIFLFPTQMQEAFGLVVVEAMASGLPVVASKVGSVESRVIENVTGRLVSPGNAEELANAIIDLLQHPEKVKDMGRKSREFVIEKHSVRSMVERYEEIYRRLFAS